MATQEQEPIRVALVDDDPDTSLLLRLATEMDPRYTLIDHFPSLAAAVPGLLHQQVDVVIVDGLDGASRTLELLAQLRVAVGRARLVVVAADDTTVPTNLAMAAGADAFLDPAALTHVGDALRLASGRLEAAA